MTDRANAVRFLLEIADALERRQLSEAGGALRVIARAITEDRWDEDEKPRCRGCEKELAYVGTGRPRSWCSERCRDRSRKPPANAKVSA